MNNQKKIAVSILILLISICSFPVLYVQATEEIQNVGTRNVRVGFFKFPGYHDIDEDGNYSGYGHEYLHEMAKYVGWTFTYVNGTWEECQEMLKNGDIDLLTSAHRTEGREQYFEFSTLPIGESYAELVVKNDNVHFSRNDFENFNGMTIGIIKSNSYSTFLKIFAKEKGFSYKSVEFLEVDDLNLALQNGKIDAILTSSLHKLSNKHVIAQFAPSVFYGIVQKGNTKLLSEMNEAISEINIQNPNYEMMLYNKYYGSNLSFSIFLTPEETAYLKNKAILRVVGPSAAVPLFYYENGTAKGISLDILKFILRNTGIQIEILHADNYKQAVAMVNNDEADVVALFQTNFNWAEKNKIRITSPYMALGYSAISKFHFTGKLQRIAIINGSKIDNKYIKFTYNNPIIIALNTEEDAILAVDENKADVALINTYSAQAILYPNYPDLKAASIDVHLNNISLGVGENVDPILYCILDKKIRSLNPITVSKIIANHTVLQQHKLTFSHYLKIHTMFLIVMFGCIFISLLLIYRWITQKRHAKKIFNLAYYDKLTNLWNKNGFELQSKNRLRSKNKSENHAIIILDIEKFSAINSDYGYKTGDVVIMEIAQHIKRSCGEDAIIARSHADNYLLFIEYTREHDFEKNLHDICNLASIFTDNGFLLKLNIRVGVYQTKNMDVQSFYTALAHSTMAHHAAKKQAVSVVYFDEDMKSRMAREKKIIDGFKQALEDGDLQVYYQPKVDMQNSKIVGAEGLIRWTHKELGFLVPNDFISLLEKTGDIVEIDFFVFEQACIMIKNWIDTSFPVVPISINQSRANFARAKYIERIQNLLEKYNIPHNVIEMEITENLFESQNVVQEMIGEIKNLGLCVSMDDFGSGYSSLALLKQVSIDTLKIDKSLIDDLESSIKARTILCKIVEMAHAIGLSVVCEGVEHKEQAEFLLEIGCKYAQGFLYSKPVCKKEFLALLNQ